MSMGSSPSWRRRGAHRRPDRQIRPRLTFHYRLSIDRGDEPNRTDNRLENLRSAVFAGRRIEQPAALAELEQGRLKPANIFAREIAAGNGRLGRTLRRVERGHGFFPPRNPMRPCFPRPRPPPAFQGRLHAVPLRPPPPPPSTRRPP